MKSEVLYFHTAPSRWAWQVATCEELAITKQSITDTGRLPGILRTVHCYHEAEGLYPATKISNSGVCLAICRAVDLPAVKSNDSNSACRRYGAGYTMLEVYCHKASRNKSTGDCRSVVCCSDRYLSEKSVCFSGC